MLCLTKTSQTKVLAAFNIYPRIVELQQVIESDVMRGALLSVLGQDYAMSAHRSLRFATLSCQLLAFYDGCGFSG